MRKTILLIALSSVALAPAVAQRLRILDRQDVAEAQRYHAELVQEHHESRQRRCEADERPGDPARHAAVATG